MKLSTRQLMLIGLGIFLIVVVHVIGSGSGESPTTPLVYSVYSYEITNERGHLSVTGMARPIESTGSYKLFSLWQDPDIILDAEPGHCTIEFTSQSEATLHIPPNHGNC